MSSSLLLTVALALLTVPSVGAHMFLANPIRFAQPKATNGPLAPDGSNWPCQWSGGPYVPDTMNVYPLGSKQVLSFLGQAVHLGGSCQLSISYDTAPDKRSVWKVIKLIEGGCPARDQTDNMGGDALAPDPYTYNFEIPNNIPGGNVTIQWSWQNKRGNWKFYAQCAPAVLTGNGGSKSNYDALPDVFLANLGNDCGTVPDTDVLYPNPGPNVERLNGATTAFAAPTGAGCQKPTGAANAPQATAPSAPGENIPPSATATNAPVGGGFITVTQARPTTTAAQVAPAPPASTDFPAPAANPGSGSGSALSGPCTTAGEYNCIAGTAFQQCASGIWSVAIPVAAGTKCTGGRSAQINIVAARAVRFEA